MNFAILTPTRGRPAKRKRFHDSVINTVDNDNQTRLYYYMDSDDPCVPEYRNQKLENCYETVGAPISVSKSWNIIANQAIRDGADFLIMGNDDLIYETYGWDIILSDVINSLEDTYWCLWFDDQLKGKRHCAFPIVSKEWYDCLGYFTPGIFNFGYNDTWIFHIAMELKRAMYIPQVKTKHDHVSRHKVFDDTSNRIYNGRQGDLYKLDSKIWATSEDKRKEDAKKLLKKIKGKA